MALPRLLLPLCTFAAGITFTIGLACDIGGHSCTLQACLAGLEWNVSPASGHPFPAGSYRLEFVLDDEQRWEMLCELPAAPDEPSCEAAMPMDGSQDQVGDWLVLAGVGPGDPASTSVSAAGFFWASIQRSEAPGVTSEYGGVTGPGSVHIDITADDVIIFSAEHWIEYERDLEYWGHRKCGFCDSVETRFDSW